MDAPVKLSSKLLFDPKGRVRHGFFSRINGGSSGLYSGLNVGLGSGDDRQSVLANRALAVGMLGAAAHCLATPHQVHSSDAVRVIEPWPDTERPKADAVVTDRPGIALGVVTADCGPVLLADHDSGVIAAVHAGWRGAIGGVLENTIAEMEALGADCSKITAALGPTISQANYEVGPEFVDNLLLHDGDNDRYLGPGRRAGHAQFDLVGYIVDRLKHAGVRSEAINRCTYGESDLFFSYRRATHRGEPVYGRQLSAIMMDA